MSRRAAAASASTAKGMAKKKIEKVDHKGKMFTHIPAQLAAPGPPLGSQLGQVGINIAAFVKDFNLKTSVCAVPSGCQTCICELHLVYVGK